MHHRSPRRIAAVLGIAILAVAVGAPAVAQDESPAPDASTVTSEGDLASLLPVEVRGLPMEPATFAGSAIIETADMDDPGQAQDVADFRALLDGLGADLDQVTLVSASAFDDQGGVIAFGMQVAGVEASSFSEPWARLYMGGEYEEPQFETVELGGKPVLSVTDAASSFKPPAYAYASGDVVWLLLGDEADIIAVLEALP
jgi:hypothetical protein